LPDIAGSFGVNLAPLWRVNCFVKVHFQAKELATMQTQTTGLLFTYRSKQYKLLDVEWRTDKSDNSFYFLPHQHDCEIGKRLCTERDANGRLVIAIDKVMTGCFPTRKISRHESGFFHVKDTASRSRGGKRETDKLRGPAFKDIAFWTILVVGPQAIETLVEVPSPLPTDIQIQLPNDVAPFTVQFAIWDLKTPFPMRDELLGGVISIEIDKKPRGLVLSLLPVKKISPETPNRFPIRTFYLVQ
jgi:hypothetical protein